MTSDIPSQKHPSATRWYSCNWMLILALAAALAAAVVTAQNPLSPSTLPRNRFRSGEETLRAFAPVSEATRHSIVKLNVDGETVALGTVVDTNGLALTKASEIKPGKLTCWLATEKEVDAEVIAVDEDEDLALVRVHDESLRPIQWSEEEVREGQWAITPGIAETPQAVGIISALPRKIRPQRAFIGVRFDFSTSMPKIEELLSGLSAEKAGLRPGDLIVAVNDAPVTNREQVVEILSDFREGQIVKVRLQREGSEFDADLKLMVPNSSQAFQYYAQERLSRLGGELSHRAEGFEQAIEHDTVLPPWLCGGPLVNLQGKAIGLNIARAGRVSSYALPAKLVKRILEHLETVAERKTAAAK